MIRIVTDSSCDLPDAMIRDLGITVVPLTVRFGADEYVDREELSHAAFWERLAVDAHTPATAAPSVGRFRSAYESLAAEGATGVLAACLSSKISATHQAANLAAQEFDAIPVSVLDSRLVSAALGLAVIQGAAAAADGGDLAGVEAVTAAAAEATRLLATLDTLEFLRRGGRIGSAAAFFGGILDVKPLISFTDGEVEAAGRVRTRRKAIDAIVEHVADRADTIEDLGIIHSDPPDLDEIVERVEGAAGRKALLARLGPVVGSHVGPGAAGVVYRLG